MKSSRDGKPGRNCADCSKGVEKEVAGDDLKKKGFEIIKSKDFERWASFLSYAFTGLIDRHINLARASVGIPDAVHL